MVITMPQRTGLRSAAAAAASAAILPPPTPTPIVATADDDDDDDVQSTTTTTTTGECEESDGVSCCSAPPTPGASLELENFPSTSAAAAAAFIAAAATEEEDEVEKEDGDGDETDREEQDETDREEEDDEEEEEEEDEEEEEEEEEEVEADSEHNEEPGRPEEVREGSENEVENEVGHEVMHQAGTNEDSDDYGDMHRLVLQGIMAAGYLDVKGVKKLFQEACKQLKCPTPAAEHLSPPFIQRVVREINERIKDYDMMIRSATCEVSGDKYYVFLVTIEKQVMKFQTYFTKQELELFKKILDALMRNHKNFTISMTDCVNIGGDIDPRSFSKSNAEDFVVKMINLQYFTKVFTNKQNKDEYEITLGFRTIREFEPIFREVYHDVFTNCCLCKMILLNGLQCPKCPAVIHRGCLKKYIKNCKNCVNCKGPWRNENALSKRLRDEIEEEEPVVEELTETEETETILETPVPNGEEVDMPILEPMVSPRNAAAAKKGGRGRRGRGRGRRTRNRVASASEDE